MQTPLEELGRGVRISGTPAARGHLSGRTAAARTAKSPREIDIQTGRYRYLARVQLIFVGDVQGCADELEDLVARAERRFGTNYRLHFVGDLINRGPASLRVLERVRGLCEVGRACAVLGNHELALLRLALGLRDPAPDDTFQELLARSDSGEWLDWVRNWPLIQTGAIGDQPFVVVHAAVAPEWGVAEIAARARSVEGRLRGDFAELEQLLAAPRSDPAADDLARFTRCRSVDPAGGWSSREPKGRERPWHVAWAERGHRYGVVYGHWALQGLHCAPGLRGLDTGCVYHGFDRNGYLTAWLPDSRRPNPFTLPDDGFWQIPARRRYWSGPRSR